MGAVPSRPRFLRDRRSRGKAAGAARGYDQAVVGRGGESQRAAARRPLRSAICRERRALPWRAQPLHLPRRHRPGVHVERLVRTEPPAKGSRTGSTEYTLLIDGEKAGSMQTPFGFHTLISWSGLDIGRDRGSPVSHYDAPFEFTGKLLKVTVA